MLAKDMLVHKQAVHLHCQQHVALLQHMQQQGGPGAARSPVSQQVQPQRRDRLLQG